MKAKNTLDAILHIESMLAKIEDKNWFGELRYYLTGRIDYFINNEVSGTPKEVFSINEDWGKTEIVSIQRIFGRGESFPKMTNEDALKLSIDLELSATWS